MRSLINSTIEDVAKKDQIGQKIIQVALDRQVTKAVDWAKIKSLETIGIDEISMKKGYRDYVTIISAKSKEASPVVIVTFHAK